MSDTWFAHISSKGKLSRVTTVETAIAAARKDGYVWLNYCQPTREELSPLTAKLGLHPLAVDDCFDENQIPKIEDYPRNTFILFNAFDYAKQRLSIGEVDLFIGNDFVVSVTTRNAENRGLLDGVDRLVERDSESVRHGPAFLLHVILDFIVDRKFVAIEGLEEELDAEEDRILADAAHFNPAELTRMRRDLLNLRKSLFHEREILVQICRNDCAFVGGKAIFHYRNVYDHLAKCFELTESYRDVVTSLMEMYLSILNNHMAKSANETNKTVRRLTFITTIFMPLTLLAGVGGMSEWSMMTGPEHWRISYPLFFLLMAVVGVANYFLLKRLEKRRS